MIDESNILIKITNERMRDIAAAKRIVSVDELQDLAKKRVHHSFKAGLSHETGEIKIISEIKKASPSAGILRYDFKPSEIAISYEAAGAVAISVLTEPRHFLGNAEHLKAVRDAVDLPILRKDFICDEYQILEAAAWGADIILLIVAALDKKTIRRLYEFAVDLELEVLVESHSQAELDIALSLDTAIIGVNSRNLKTLETDLSIACGLADSIPANRISIAESGIKNRSDIDKLAALGYKGFLIGETLMKGNRPGEALKNLLTDHN